MVCKLDTVIRKNGVDFVGNGFQRVLKKIPCCFAIRFVDKLRNCELAGAVDGLKEMQLAFPVRTSAMSIWK